MRKKITLLAVFTIAASIGLTGNGWAQGKPLSGSVAVAAVASPQELTASQKDSFHTGSKVESSRKGKLTSFGTILSELPPETLQMEAAGAALNPPDMAKMNIQRLENHELIFSSFPFDYENDLAVLKSLYQIHGLDKIIRPDMTDLEKLSTLSLYTYRFLDGGTVPAPGAESGPSAILITQNRRDKGIGGTSATYAALFCQLALSCGYSARLVGMHTLDDSGNALTHDICEVYMNTFRKWVAFDPFNRATYYLRGNTPVSALEIHTCLVENRIRELSPVSAIADLADIVSLRENIIPRYRYIYLLRMNNILGLSPRGGSIPWQTLYQAHLVWEDRLTPVSKGGFDKLDRFANGGVKYITHARSDFEWTLNLINITIQRTGPDSIKLFYNTVTPNFDHFECKIAEKPAKASNINEYKSPFNLYTIYSVNAFGARSEASVVEFSQQ